MIFCYGSLERLIQEGNNKPKIVLKLKAIKKKKQDINETSEQTNHINTPLVPLIKNKKNKKKQINNTRNKIEWCKIIHREAFLF